MLDTEIIEKTIKRLKKITDKSICKGKTEEALAALSTIASLEYAYNQCYVDEYIEEKVIELAAFGKNSESRPGNVNTVLFYDGFGVDTRGLVLIYLNALVKLQYRVIYITKAKDGKLQPQVMKLLGNANSVIYNLGQMSHTALLSRLRRIFSAESFGTAFYYTTPNDIAGAVAFRELFGRCRRYLINLTDHAFWVGRESVDYCIEFREYGESISYYYRGFKREQLLKLPYYPVVNQSIAFQGFPDELKSKKVIFSGGSLYKTMDESGTYYRIVEQIIRKHPEAGFLYAGTGNDSLIKKIVRKFPGQAFYIGERNDLYEVMKHAYLYLNTYPISGALMLQYAVRASCIPVTLKREWDDDVSGILRYEEKLGETFVDDKLMLQEIDRLLEDDAYKKKKEAVLSDMVISEKEFTERLDQIIKGSAFNYGGYELKKFDTVRFREQYKKNFNRRLYLSHLVNGGNVILYKFFPMKVIERVFGKIFRFLSAYRSL